MKKWLDINAANPEDAKVVILGIPFDGGTSQEAGAAEGPAKIREFGAVYMPCATDDWHVLDTQPVVHDFGDVDMSGTWEESFARVEAEALKVMGYDKFHLFIGGDHSVTIPLHKAFAKARKGEKIGVIHFDAHFDLCDCYDGHIWSHANTEKRALDDIIDPEDLLFLGIRAAEPEEVEIIQREPGITVISASDVDEIGWKECTKIIGDKFKGYDHIYFTLDIDVDSGFGRHHLQGTHQSGPVHSLHSACPGHGYRGGRASAGCERHHQLGGHARDRGGVFLRGSETVEID